MNDEKHNGKRLPSRELPRVPRPPVKRPVVQCPGQGEPSPEFGRKLKKELIRVFLDTREKGASE